jgi:hypothetical protein
MKELFEDEELKSLMRREGSLSTSPGFTNRVLGLIEESQKEGIFSYKPLISKRNWILIITGSLLTVLICWLIFTLIGNIGIKDYGISAKISEYIKSIHFSIALDYNTLLIATTAILSIGLLLTIDIWFSNKRSDTLA